FFGEVADGSPHWTQAAYAAGAALVAAMAAWLAAKPRTFDWREVDYLPVLVATSLILVITWVPFGFQVFIARWFSTTRMGMLGGAPVLWATLGALGCALITAPRRRLKALGVTLLAAVVLANLGARIVDASALSRSVASTATERLPLRRVARLELPAFASDLR